MQAPGRCGRYGTPMSDRPFLRARLKKPEARVTGLKVVFVANSGHSGSNDMDEKRRTKWKLGVKNLGWLVGPEAR